MNKIKMFSKKIISNGMKKTLKTISFYALAILVGITAVYATSKLTPPGSVTNTMYSLTDIYNLSAGTTATEGSGAIEATPGTISETGKTLTEVYTAISTEIAKLANAKIAKDISAFGYTGTLYGDTDPAKVLTTATYPGTATAGGGLLKTGQTTCWNTDGSAQNPCLAGNQTDGGQDGYYQKGTALSYTDNADGTISDNVTGLDWKKCTEGQTGTNCDSSGSASDYGATYLDWTTALSTCEADTTGGHTDWRLPNVRELGSIVDYGSANPAIDTTFFPNTQSGLYWSSTTCQYPGLENNAWSVGMGDGGMGSSNKASTGYVRCVRG